MIERILTTRFSPSINCNRPHIVRVKIARNSRRKPWRSEKLGLMSQMPLADDGSLIARGLKTSPSVISDARYADVVDAGVESPDYGYVGAKRISARQSITRWGEVCNLVDFFCWRSQRSSPVSYAASRLGLTRQLQTHARAGLGQSHEI